jgi:tetratricopeptide (TPR) repeat protein
MTVTDDLLEQILGRGPSAGYIVATFERMKEEGRLNEVVRQCIRFLDLYPDDVRLRTLLARSYAEMGFVALAESELRKTTTMIDDLAAAYRLMAEIYERQQRYDDAADALRRYLAHYPKDSWALERLAGMRADRVPDEPVDEGTLAGDLGGSEDVSADELVDFATPTIAELYYSQGRIDAAVRMYEKLLTDSPGDEELMERLDQLREMVHESQAVVEQAGSAALRKEERMMTILERWLPRIRGLKHA